MIDWYLVATSGLWILGLAVVLAAFGYHRWEARTGGRSLRAQLRQPSWRLPWSVGLCLVCLGAGLSQNRHAWERAVWLALAGVAAWRGTGAARALRRRGHDDSRPTSPRSV